MGELNVLIIDRRRGADGERTAAIVRAETLDHRVAQTIVEHHQPVASVGRAAIDFEGDGLERQFLLDEFIADADADQVVASEGVDFDSLHVGQVGGVIGGESRVDSRNGLGGWGGKRAAHEQAIGDRQREIGNHGSRRFLKQCADKVVCGGAFDDNRVETLITTEEVVARAVDEGVVAQAAVEDILAGAAN